MELKYSEKTLDITAYVVVAMSIVLFVVLLILPKVKSNHSKKEKVMDSTVYKTEQESNTEEEITANDVEYPEEEIINELDITIDDISEANIKEIETIANKELEEDIDYYKCMTDGTASVAGVYVLTNDAKDKNIVYALINRNITFYDLPLSYYNFLKFNDVEKVNDQIDFTEQSYVQTNSLGKDGTFMASNENGERELAGYETVESFEEQVIKPLHEEYKVEEKREAYSTVKTDDKEENRDDVRNSVKNDFYYNHGFDNLYEIKVGEEVGIFTNVTDDNNNIVNHGKTTFKIEEYYRFEGNTSFPQKDGYEWCYFKYVSPINSASEGYVPTEIVSCINEFKNPVWKGKPDDEGFYTFGLSIDEKEFNDCLFTHNDYFTETDDVSECWFRIPQGYDGITIVYGCMTAGQYRQRNGELPDYPIDLITEDTKYFRLVACGMKTCDEDTNINNDTLSGDYYQEFESDAYYHIEKKSDDIWTLDTVYIDTGKAVEGFPTQEFILKEEGVWECITPSHEGYTIQKIGDDRILVTEEFEYFELVKR